MNEKIEGEKKKVIDFRRIDKQEIELVKTFEEDYSGTYNYNSQSFGVK